MKHAIHVNTLSSVFQDSSEKSKQTSQLLFGEFCVVKSEREEYFYIENFQDKHCGWVLKKSFLVVADKEVDKLKAQDLLRVCMPLVDAFNLRDKTVLRLPAGSIIPNYNPDLNKFVIEGLEFQIHPSFVSYLPHGNMDGMVEIAQIFLNTPFMYGGKTVLGIDKTGFVQLIFNLCGYSMPRGIQDQAKVGVPVYSIEQLRMGDILFIKNNNNYTDVMVYLHDDKLIGVDGKVRIIRLEEIDTTTTNHSIRRLV